MKNVLALAAGLLLAGSAAGSAHAGAFTDPTGDFLSTYTGAAAADLDITSAAAIRSATGVTLSLTTSGTIGTSPGAIYVWGINRGAGTPVLSFGSPSVGASTLFDAVFVMFPAGNARVAAFNPMAAPTVTNFASGLTVAGNSISGFVPFSLLPSRGLDPVDYTYSLWSRNRVNPLVDGTNAEIADFLPATQGFTASVPEPASWAMLVSGFGLVGLMVRRRQQRALPVAV